VVTRILASPEEVDPGMGTATAKRLSAEEVLAALEAVTAGFGVAGEVRAGQQDMAIAVAKAIDLGTPLVVQAGCGVGKSISYGVVAALSERKVLVVTATKALQDQLAGKDLPAIAAALGGRLRWAVLKGRGNYLCQQAADERAAAARKAGAALTLDFDGGLPGEEEVDVPAQEIDHLITWGMQSLTGDRAELDFEPAPAAWSAVSVGHGECPGAKKCPRTYRSSSPCSARGNRRPSEGPVAPWS